MKKTVLFASLLVAANVATASFAGSLNDSAVTPQLIIEDTTSSSSGALLVVALSYLILVPVLE